MSEVTLEQVESRLIAILNTMSFKAITKRDKEWGDAYTALNSLLLDIQVSKPETTQRDTQFQGFAKLLTDELIKYLTSRAGLTLDEIEQEWRKVIARRAYDLAKHAAFYIDEKDCDVLGFDEAVWRIPDMTEWTKEEE